MILFLVKGDSASTIIDIGHGDNVGVVLVPANASLVGVVGNTITSLVNPASELRTYVLVKDSYGVTYSSIEVVLVPSTQSILSAQQNDVVNYVGFEAIGASVHPKPVGVYGSVVSGAQIGIHWNPVVIAKSYNVYRDGIKIGTTAGTSFYDTSVTSGTSHIYYITEINQDGAESTPSSGVTMNTNAGFGLSGFGMGPWGY